MFVLLCITVESAMCLGERIDVFVVSYYNLHILGEREHPRSRPHLL